MSLTLLACVCTLWACNDAGTNPFLIGDASTMPDDGRPDAGSNANTCLGCLVGGECFDGDEDTRCGAGGTMCEDCGSDSICSETGECIDDPLCAAECDGCCDATGGCQSGNEAMFCGSGGLACSACPDDAACVDGRCERNCGPDTCAGCCDASGQCVTGADDADCGAAGGACVDCTPGGDECSMGSCVSTACADTCDGCCDGDTCVEPATDDQCGASGIACVDCGAGRVCGASGCELNIDTMWSIRVVSGEVAPSQPGGGAWDGGNGLPDPYVTFVIANQADRSSSTIDNSLTPVWDETLADPVNAADLLAGVTILYRDSDVVFDDEICDITVALNGADFGGDLIESTCPDPTHGKVVWRLLAP